MGYPHQPALGGGSGLMDIINRTSEFDYSAGLDGFGNPLPDRVTNFFQDSELSKQELDNLLQNIRPDMELLEENCDATPAGLKHPLYRHQVLALTWMKQMEDGTNKGGILADDMGLGKTISTLALILDRPAECRPKTNLIIGPLSLLRQWEEELAKKTKLSHRLSVFIHHGTKATTDDLLKYDVVLTTYGTIAAELGRFDKIVSDNKDRNLDWSDRALASKCPLLNPKKAVFYRIILDEAQLIKNKDTKTAKACHKLRATYRWCLTGTPMMNGILELWSLIHFLRIKPYADWEKFRVSFGRLFGKKGDPKATAMSRLRALLKAIMLRRKKNSELDGKPILNLPEKSEEVVYADLSPKERANYVQIEERSRNLFRQYVEQDTVGKNYSNILVMLLRMRQACCHPHLDLNAHVDDTAVDDHMLDVVGRLDPATVVRIKAIEAFECPVCQDAVQSPSFFFPCGHDCCRQCLISIVDTALDSNLRQGAESDKAKCPLCRGGFDPKNCFTYEAFQQIHMPEAFEEAKQENADTDEDTEASDSDWDEESNDEVDAKGNLKDFIVDDDVWNDDDNKAVVQEATSNGTVSNGVDDCESKKIRQAAKGKKKKPEMKTSTLKSLRQNAHKSRDAYKKYMRYLRKTWIPAAKVSKCIELIKSIQETGEKTIIFSQWTLHLDLIEVAMHHAKLAKPERYDGSMSGDERSVASRRFRDNANIKVMLVSLRAGNAGLNLVAASRVIIMDPFWNPYIEMQAVDRAYRIGQTKPVKVYRILTEETIEDRIVELQEKKKEMVEAALDETESKKIGRLGVHELRFLFNTSRD
jgi:SNF2 family DNA or RNA helicase